MNRCSISTEPSHEERLEAAMQELENGRRRAARCSPLNQNQHIGTISNKLSYSRISEMEKGRSEYYNKQQEETTPHVKQEARRVRFQIGTVSKTAAARTRKPKTRNRSKRQKKRKQLAKAHIARYEQETKILSQEHDTEVIHNIGLERDLEDIEQDIAALRQEFEPSIQEEEHEDVAVEIAGSSNDLQQQYNPQDIETYEEEEQDVPSDDEETLLGPVDPNLINGDIIQTGDQLDAFRIGRLLGSGAFAKVFKASLIDDSQHDVAIKCINTGSVRWSNSRREELDNELTILMQIKHPNITHALHVYHASHTVYVVMELAQMDLYSYFHDVNKKKPFSNDTLREVMIGILHPLEFLHSIGICHSDIKMENTLVMPSNGHSDSIQITRQQIRLADFGLASISSSTDPSDPVLQHNFKGTSPLTAPEVFWASKRDPYDARPVDMFAVGCTLLEMTDGYPQGWEDAYAIAKTNIDTFIEEIEGGLEEYRCKYHVVNDYANDIICRLLRMDPKQRLTASKVLQHEWFDDCFGSNSNSDEFVESGDQC